jgi:hypothetical protein
VNIVVSDEPRSWSNDVSRLRRGLLRSGLDDAVVDGEGFLHPVGVGGTTTSDGPSIQTAGDHARPCRMKGERDVGYNMSC